MTRFEPWHHRQEVTSQEEAMRAVKTFRREASWNNVPPAQLAEILFPWLRRGWCLKALQRAWEITPNDKPQFIGDPEADPLGTLRKRLNKWKDNLGTPLDPPIASMTAEQIVEVHQRQRDQIRNHGRPATDETRAQLVGRATAAEQTRQRRYRVDRVADSRERDEKAHAALRDLDRLAGTTASGAPHTDSASVPATTGPGFPGHAGSEHGRQLTKYDQFLTELALQVKNHGVDSLTEAQETVLRVRGLTVRHLIALVEFVDTGDSAHT